MLKWEFMLLYIVKHAERKKMKNKTKLDGKENDSLKKN